MTQLARHIYLVIATLLTALAGAPAAAATFSLAFASFTTQPGGTFYWQNDAAIGGPGSGGSIFTTTTPLTPAPGAIPILFNWPTAGFNNVAATMLFRGVAVNSPAVVSGPTFQVIQDNIGAGSFNIDVGALTVLSGTYTKAFIVSNIGASSALLITNVFPGGLVVSSTIAPVPPGCCALSIFKTGVTPLIAIGPGGALASFDPAATGTFFSLVPEPATWALLIIGFGAAGTALRVRRRSDTVTA